MSACCWSPGNLSAFQQGSDEKDKDTHHFVQEQPEMRFFQSPASQQKALPPLEHLWVLLSALNPPPLCVQTSC